MKTSIAVVLCLCANVARADFTYLAQSGSAKLSYSVATSTPPTNSVSWTEPTGFVDYNQTIIFPGQPPVIAGPNISMQAAFRATELTISGNVFESLLQTVNSGDSVTGIETRSVTFRNDAAQTWTMTGHLLARPITNSIFAVSCSFVGSDGTDKTFSLTPNLTELSFTGQINPGISYTLSFNDSVMLSGPSGINSVPNAQFSVDIGQTLPEPSTLGLAMVGVLVAMRLRCT